jgi:hypothetical protein
VERKRKTRNSNKKANRKGNKKLKHTKKEKGQKTNKLTLFFYIAQYGHQPNQDHPNLAL